jgi:hypothetical protein
LTPFTAPRCDPIHSIGFSMPVLLVGNSLYITVDNSAVHSSNIDFDEYHGH